MLELGFSEGKGEQSRQMKVQDWGLSEMQVLPDHGGSSSLPKITYMWGKIKNKGGSSEKIKEL